MPTRRSLALLPLLASLFAGCAPSLRPFPERPPLARDSDLEPVHVRCRREPTQADAMHVVCAPRVYVSPLAWDGADNMVFRPLSSWLAVEASHEAVNVNSLDEVADSAWFTGRLGARPMTAEDVTRGACAPEQLLAPDEDADGTWTIDQGKPNGASPGFRVSVPGKGQYMLKADTPDEPERPSAASVIGAAAYHAAGFFTSCEQVVYVRPSVFALKPGLTFRNNADEERPFDAAALSRVLAGTPTRDGRVRLQASAWLPGRLLGPFRYERRRDDDPNDVIPHEDRRELRGARILASWLEHHDAREQNTMDAWISVRHDVPDSSPGHVRHHYLDFSDCLGSSWPWDGVSRRLGRSYVLDWGDVATDFFSLGIVSEPWESVARSPGREIFGYFNARDFEPERWKNEYPNPAFDRMTERDAAWMARILSRFTPEMLSGLVALGRFSDAENGRYLADVLEGRLARILDRYLTRLSPLADVHVEGRDRLCAEDLALARGVRSGDAFRFAARVLDGQALPVEVHGAHVCVVLPPALAAPRYLIVSVTDGVVPGPLVAHLYDRRPASGLLLAGLERPAR